MLYFSVQFAINFYIQAYDKPRRKGPNVILDKSCIVYKFNCSSDRIYIGQTTRHFKIRIKDHIPRCVEDYISGKNVRISKAVINAAISEHLKNKADCAKTYNISMFSIMKQCAVLISLIWLKWKPFLFTCIG